MSLSVLRGLDGPLGGTANPPEVYGVRAMSMSPGEAAASVPQASSRMWLTKVRCIDSFTLATMAAFVTSAGSGLTNYDGYVVHSDGPSLTLIGSTPTDSTLFTATGWRPKALSAPVRLSAGSDYWFGLLSTAATQPSFAAATVINAGVFNLLPAGTCVAILTGQISPGSTITKASLAGFASRPLIVGY